MQIARKQYNYEQYSDNKAIYKGNRNNLRIIDNTSKKNNSKIVNKKNLITTTILFATLGAFFLFSIFRYAKIEEINQKINLVNREKQTLESDRDNLLMAIEPYKSSHGIEDVAKDKLMMRYPNEKEKEIINERIKILSKEKSSINLFSKAQRLILSVLKK